MVVVLLLQKQNGTEYFSCLSLSCRVVVVEETQWKHIGNTVETQWKNSALRTSADGRQICPNIDTIFFCLSLSRRVVEEEGAMRSAPSTRRRTPNMRTCSRPRTCRCVLCVQLCSAPAFCVLWVCISDIFMHMAGWVPCLYVLCTRFMHV